uniref:Uncharacterized protein n=1 Tax=Lepeophtheirus salmonis TaxID=72036 RepID=A0A0K2U8C6_LEPSM
MTIIYNRWDIIINPRTDLDGSYRNGFGLDLLVHGISSRFVYSIKKESSHIWWRSFPYINFAIIIILSKISASISSLLTFWLKSRSFSIIVVSRDGLTPLNATAVRAYSGRSPTTVSRVSFHMVISMGWSFYIRGGRRWRRVSRW